MLVGLVATCTDIKSRRIPNKLTYPASIVGIVGQSAFFASFATHSDLVFRAVVGAADGVLGWCTGFTLMVVIKLFLKKFGHGDTKLMAALGAFLGPAMVFAIYIYYSLAFGVFAVFRLVPAVPWYQMWLAAEVRKAGGTPEPVDFSHYKKVAREDYIPVGPFIAIGAVCAILLEQPTMAYLFPPPP